MEAAITIKTLDGEQFRALRSALVSLYLEGYRGLEQYAYNARWMVRRYLGWLYHGDPQGFFVLQVKGELAGFIAVHSRWIWEEELWGEIHELVIAPAFRHQGLGRRLIEHALRYLASCGCRRVGLWVGKENEVAKKLYRQMGFHYEGIHGVWERWTITLSPP